MSRPTIALLGLGVPTFASLPLFTPSLNCWLLTVLAARRSAALYANLCSVFSILRRRFLASIKLLDLALFLRHTQVRYILSRYSVKTTFCTWCWLRKLSRSGPLVLLSTRIQNTCFGRHSTNANEMPILGHFDLSKTIWTCCIFPLCCCGVNLLNMMSSYCCHVKFWSNIAFIPTTFWTSKEWR